MKKVSARSWLSGLLAGILLLGLAAFFGMYFLNADAWVSFPGSPHVYTGVNPDCGKVYDREGELLLDMTDGRRYSADAQTRTATVHLLGDRDGYISAPLLKTYVSQMIGFDLVNGLYEAGGAEVSSRLTISAEVQRAALQALGSYAGTIGVYNYKTGELICAVTSPSYDPDNVPDIENDTTGAYNGVYLNRFFDASYTPGSIFKLVTTVCALENLDGALERTFSCAGKTIIGGQEIICNGVHGKIGLAEALAHSCNVAFGELAAELGAEKLQSCAKKLGLTETMECDGYTAASGRVDLSGADDGDVAWAGIGQYTDAVSAPGFLRFLGAVANEGRAAQPYLMQRVRNREEISYEAEASFEKLLDAQTAKTLGELMRNNVQTVYGDWQFDGLSVCAKSGTAEREGQTANAMFAGFVQDESCPVAFVVFVEGGGAGSAVAAPMAAQVLKVCRRVLTENA